MNYFKQLTTWTPDDVRRHLLEVHGDPQLTRYFRRIIIATPLDAERIGEALTADALENLWKEMFSQHEREQIWS